MSDETPKKKAHKRKLNTRWRKGAERYTRADEAVLRKAAGARLDGWRNGARVTKR